MANTRPVLAARIVMAVASTAIPIAILGTLVHQGHREVLDSAERERLGAQYVASVVSLSNALGRHRVVELLCRVEAPECETELARSRDQLDAALQELERAHEAHAESLELDTQIFVRRGVEAAHPDHLVPAIRAALESSRSEPDAADQGSTSLAAEGFAEEDEFSEELLGDLSGARRADGVFPELHQRSLSLLRLVADRSGMLHDPAPDGFQLAALVALYFPTLQLDTVALVPLRATPSFGGSAESGVVAQLVDTRDREAAAWALDSVRGHADERAPQMHDELLAEAAALDERIHAFAVRVPAFDDEERLAYARDALTLVSAFEASWRTALRAFEQALELRVSGAQAQQQNIVRITSAVVLLVLALVVLTLRAMARPVRALVEAAAKIRDGDLSVRAPGAQRRDELGALAQAFNRMVGAVDERDRALHRHATELTDMVTDRTAAIQAMLDASDEGLMVMDLEGNLRQERSRAIDAYFGAPSLEHVSAADYLAPHDPIFRDMFALSLEDLRDGFLPAEVVLAQMPKRLLREERSYALRYDLIEGSAKSAQAVLVSVRDTTDSELRERAGRIQRELPALVSALVRDRTGFVGFVDSSEMLLSKVMDSDADAIERLRALHTLKGNTALYGMASFAAECHTVETELADAEDEAWLTSTARLAAHFRATLLPIEELLRDVERGVVTLMPQELRAFAHQLREGHDRDALVATVAAWQREPLAQLLAPTAAATERLGASLGKRVAVQLDVGALRLPSTELRPFVASLVHVLRNALDHGLETVEERAAAGKSPIGSIRIRSRADTNTWRIELEDDGRGIDWDKLRERAAALGIDVAEEDPIEALFADGCSTAESVSAISGRGVGMGAVRALCVDLGGQVEVSSKPGSGTTFAFSFPIDADAVVRATYPSLFPHRDRLPQAAAGAP